MAIQNHAEKLKRVKRTAYVSLTPVNEDAALLITQNVREAHVIVGDGLRNAHLLKDGERQAYRLF